MCDPRAQLHKLYHGARSSGVAGSPALASKSQATLFLLCTNSSLNVVCALHPVCSLCLSRRVPRKSTRLRAALPCFVTAVPRAWVVACSLLGVLRVCFLSARSARCSFCFSRLGLVVLGPPLVVLPCRSRCPVCCPSLCLPSSARWFLLFPAFFPFPRCPRPGGVVVRRVWLLSLAVRFPLPFCRLLLRWFLSRLVSSPGVARVRSGRLGAPSGALAAGLVRPSVRVAVFVGGPPLFLRRVGPPLRALPYSSAQKKTFFQKQCSHRHHQHLANHIHNTSPPPATQQKGGR